MKLTKMHGLGNDFILTRRGIGYYLNPALQRPE